MEMMLTKEDLLKLFKKNGIQKGMVVMVESKGMMTNYIAGGEQMVIEVLKELIGSQGCILAPSFTFDTLDPATDGEYHYDYSLWEEVRNSTIGYDKKISQSNDGFANQLLRNPESGRSTHPVYSFVMLGRYDQKQLRQGMNFPISLHDVLSPLAERKSCLIVFDGQIEKSCFFHALAQQSDQQDVFVQRAYKKHGKEKEIHTFLMNRPHTGLIRRFLNGSNLNSFEIQDHDIEFCSFDMRHDKRWATPSKKTMSSKEKR